MNHLTPKPTVDRLLIVEDEALIRALFRDVAEDMNYSVTEAECGRTFFAALKISTPTIIFLDLTMPDTDGVELLRAIADINFAGPVILASGQDKRVLSATQRLGRMLGLDMPAILTKPVSIDAICDILEKSRQTVGNVTVADIQSGIENDEFELYYQPKVSLVSGDNYTITGAEALLRWNHPRHGRVRPDDFIPLAEDSDQIKKLTDMVLDKALSQMRDFAQAGLTIPVSVNVSPVDLTDLSLPDRVASRLDAYNVDPRQLVLEITEQAAMSDVCTATDILTRLRIKDIAVSLDDFGAGYSSMVEIYRMPLSELKIDASLVADLDNDPGARTVMKAITALARELSLPTCVEGIETTKTAEFLTSIGCKTGQGYYFSRPLSADMFQQHALKRQTLTDRPIQEYA